MELARDRVPCGALLFGGAEPSGSATRRTV
jgi:hypothetical protein